MNSEVFKNININCICVAVPSNIQNICLESNDRYIKTFVKNTGVEQRHISITEQTCLDLGYIGINHALEHCGWQAADLDLILFDTQTPDYNGGTCNSVLLHHYLNAKNTCICFDIPLGCSGFAYSLYICSSIMQNKNINKAAIIIGDNQWHLYKDKEELLSQKTFLMGEGVGVVLLEKNNNSSDINIQLGTDGHGYKHLCHFDTGIKNSWLNSNEYILPNGEKYTKGNYMDGIEVSLFVNTTIKNFIKDYFDKTGSEYDHYVFHQANAQILKSLIKNLGIDPQKVPLSIAKYANTSAASTLVTICDALYKNNDLLHIFCANFGIGFSWGAMDFKLKKNTILPIINTDFKLNEHALKIYGNKV